MRLFLGGRHPLCKTGTQILKPIIGVGLYLKCLKIPKLRFNVEPLTTIRIESKFAFTKKDVFSNMKCNILRNSLFVLRFWIDPVLILKIVFPRKFVTLTKTLFFFQVTRTTQQYSLGTFFCKEI